MENIHERAAGECCVGGLTHFAITVLATATGSGKRFEIGLHGAADEGMQTLIGSLIAAKKVHDMKLCR